LVWRRRSMNQVVKPRSQHQGLSLEHRSSPVLNSSRGCPLTSARTSARLVAQRSTQVHRLHSASGAILRGIDDKRAVIDHQVLVRAIEPQLLAQWINRPGIQRPCLVCLSPVCSCLPGTGTTEDLWSRVRRLLCECASLAASSESIEREAQKGPNFIGRSAFEIFLRRPPEISKYHLRKSGAVCRLTAKLWERAQVDLHRSTT
jgi:hypothetical protein